MCARACAGMYWGWRAGSMELRNHQRPPPTGSCPAGSGSSSARSPRRTACRPPGCRTPSPAQSSKTPPGAARCGCSRHGRWGLRRVGGEWVSAEGEVGWGGVSRRSAAGQQGAQLGFGWLPVFAATPDPTQSLVYSLCCALPSQCWTGAMLHGHPSPATMPAIHMPARTSSIISTLNPTIFNRNLRQQAHQTCRRWRGRRRSTRRSAAPTPSGTRPCRRNPGMGLGRGGRLRGEWVGGGGWVG